MLRRPRAPRPCRAVRNILQAVRRAPAVYAAGPPPYRSWPQYADAAFRRAPARTGQKNGGGGSESKRIIRPPSPKKWRRNETGNLSVVCHPFKKPASSVDWYLQNWQVFTVLCKCDPALFRFGHKNRSPQTGGKPLFCGAGGRPVWKNTENRRSRTAHRAAERPRLPHGGIEHSHRRNRAALFKGVAAGGCGLRKIPGRESSLKRRTVRPVGMGERIETRVGLGGGNPLPGGLAISRAQAGRAERGVRISPIPSARWVPPVRQNGTSAPTDAARESIRSRESGFPNRTFAPGEHPGRIRRGRTQPRLIGNPLFNKNREMCLCLQSGLLQKGKSGLRGGIPPVGGKPQVVAAQRNGRLPRITGGRGQGQPVAKPDALLLRRGYGTRSWPPPG